MFASPGGIRISETKGEKRSVMVSEVSDSLPFSLLEFN